MNHNFEHALINELEKELEKSQLEIHIKVKQRNGRKCWTIIEGLEKLDIGNLVITEYLNKIATQLRKKLNCGASITDDNYITLSGDHRNEIKEFLVKNNIAKVEQIKTHGF